MDDNKTIIPPGPQEHCRQQKKARPNTSNKHYGGYAKVTICSLTTASDVKDKRTAIVKNDTNDAKHVAIDSVHAQHDQPIIRLAQRGQNTAYRLGSMFN
jgi:hypothetical protein